MLIRDGYVGMVVSFGRTMDDQTRGEIVKVNRKRFKVKTTEPRGQWPAGTIWNVYPSICVPVSAPVHRSATPSKNVERALKSIKDARVARKAEVAAEKFTTNLERGCSLFEPPTYITHSRYYLDGKRLDKWGREYDSQKRKVYRAEDPVGLGAHFSDIAQAQAYLDNLYDSTWFQDRFATTAKPDLIETWGGGSNYGQGGLHAIRLSRKNHMYERILLHELAHAIVRPPHAGHGRLYAAVYADLVRYGMGEGFYEVLMTNFKREGVKFEPYSKILR